MKIVIYTDGGCEPNPGKGCWSFVCVDPYYEGTGYELDTTSNRMELLGVINAIRYGLKLQAESIEIFSDSQYVVKGFNEWMHGWKKNNWKRKEKNHFVHIKNEVLWRDLYLLKDAAIVKWIRGHNGNKYNEIADGLVRMSYTEKFGGSMNH